MAITREMIMDYFNRWTRLGDKGIYPITFRDLEARSRAYRIIRSYRREGQHILICNGRCPRYGRMTYNVFDSIREALNAYTNSR